MSVRMVCDTHGRPQPCAECETFGGPDLVRYRPVDAPGAET